MQESYYYPPRRPKTAQSTTIKFAMKVKTLSSGPVRTVLRAVRSQDWIERSSDRTGWDSDPILELTDECRRVIDMMEETTNQPSYPHGRKQPTTIGQLDWSRFEDSGFSKSLIEPSPSKTRPERQPISLNGSIVSKLPLPLSTPFKTMVTITRFSFDQTFWWVWMTSRAPEETPARKEVFSRCVVIELSSQSGGWAVLEEHLMEARPPARSSRRSAVAPLPPNEKKGSSSSLSQTLAKMWKNKK